jgi:hypothetical protein
MAKLRLWFIFGTKQQKQDGGAGHGGIFLQLFRLLNIRSFAKSYLVLFKNSYKLLQVTAPIKAQW